MPARPFSPRAASRLQQAASWIAQAVSWAAAEAAPIGLLVLRKGKGVSQEALGFLAGLHRTHISLLERRGREPRLATLLKLAKAAAAKKQRPSSLRAK